MRFSFQLIILIALFLLIETSTFALKSTLYFKIALDEQTYYENVLSDFDSVDNKLQYLAVKLIEKTLDLEDIDSDYYQINIYYNVRFLDDNLNVYNFVPIFNDRFRHVVWVKGNLVLREEVYDLFDKLLYYYVFLNYDDSKEKIKKIYRKVQVDTVPVSYYKGFNAIYIKTENNIMHVLYSDGLNRFSIFKKKFRKSIPEENKIIFGNYVYRIAKNGYIYAIIGTIPFKEMKRFLYLYIKKEEEKQ
jgi:sigma-E factor negative regulatory protein RseB